MKAAILAREIEEGLANGTSYDDPYPLTYFTPFSQKTYEAIRTNLPSDDVYKYLLGHADTTLPGDKATRRYLSLHEDGTEPLSEPQRSFWRTMGAALASKEVASVFMRHLAPVIEKRFARSIEEVECHSAPRLMRDIDGYRISPHPDGLGRLITVLLYLPADESQEHCGTSIYRRGSGSEDYELVRTLPFLPNTGFCFARSDNSFHGFESTRLTQVRDSLALSCFVKPVSF